MTKTVPSSRLRSKLIKTFRSSKLSRNWRVSRWRSLDSSWVWMKWNLKTSWCPLTSLSTRLKPNTLARVQERAEVSSSTLTTANLSLSRLPSKRKMCFFKTLTNLSLTSGQQTTTLSYRESTVFSESKRILFGLLTSWSCKTWPGFSKERSSLSLIWKGHCSTEEWKPTLKTTIAP